MLASAHALNLRVIAVFGFGDCRRRRSPRSSSGGGTCRGRRRGGASGRPVTSTAGRSVGMRQLRGSGRAEGARRPVPRSPEFAAKAHQHDVSVRFRAIWQRGHGSAVRDSTPDDRPCRPHEEGVSPQTIVIVGASLAGLRATETLRRDGFDGRLVARRCRAAPPVRPAAALEAAARRASSEPDDIALRARALRRARPRPAARRAGRPRSTSRRASARPRRRRARRVRRARARDRRAPRTPAEHARPRRHLRAAHARRRARAPRRARRRPAVVVVGAGFIGAEVAATCRGRGLEVTVLEALPAPLVRGLGPVLGMVVRRAAPRPRRRPAPRRRRRRHRGRRRGSSGCGSTTAPRSTPTSSSSASASRRSPTGSRAPASTLDNGVVCDETLLAAPGVVAAGDVARWPNPLFDGELMRLEHWTNAAEQGVAAARRLLGGDGAGAEPFAPVPFVWSDQYDRKIQTVGHFRGDDDMAGRARLARRAPVRRGVRSRRSARRRAGFSMPAQVMQYRKMIEERGVLRRRARAHVARRARHATSSVAPDAPVRRRRHLRVCYFLAMGRCCPVIPRYVDNQLARHDSPSASRSARSRSARSCCGRSPGGSGDRFGRRVLMVGGALIVGRHRGAAGLVPGARVADRDADPHGPRRGVLLRGRDHDGHRPRAGRAAR